MDLDILDKDGERKFNSNMAIIIQILNPLFFHKSQKVQKLSF